MTSDHHHEQCRHTVASWQLSSLQSEIRQTSWAQTAWRTWPTSQWLVVVIIINMSDVSYSSVEWLIGSVFVSDRPTKYSVSSAEHCDTWRSVCINPLAIYTQRRYASLQLQGDLGLSSGITQRHRQYRYFIHCQTRAVPFLRYLSKVANSNLPHLHLAPPLWSHFI